MPLFHFSEDPDIKRFEPHIARTSKIQDEAFVWAIDEWHAPMYYTPLARTSKIQDEAFVWAIDEWHAPMYYTPRDCPRACFWAGEKTSHEDRERWLGGLEPRFVMAIES